VSRFWGATEFYCPSSLPFFIGPLASGNCATLRGYVCRCCRLRALQHIPVLISKHRLSGISSVGSKIKDHADYELHDKIKLCSRWGGPLGKGRQVGQFISVEPPTLDTSGSQSCSTIDGSWKLSTHNKMTGRRRNANKSLNCDCCVWKQRTEPRSQVMDGASCSQTSHHAPGPTQLHGLIP
jgi:hypothetical protein